jgi:hypothetical protein
MDVASGQAKLLGTDPWAVPERTLHPTWSPDSKWVAFAARLNTLFRAIFVANVETGEKKQVTDGLADAMFPVWDASGKYLWFLASTDLGLGSQWLDMTSYDREENFALYLAVLKKGDASPLLPESDEEKVAASDAPKPAPSASPSPSPAAEKASGAVTVTIDFDGLQQRIVAVGGVPERQYSDLKAGQAGTVYYLQAPRRGQRCSREHAASLQGQRSQDRGVRHERRRVRRERRREEAALPHSFAGRGPGGGEASTRVPRCSSSMPTSRPPRARASSMSPCA